MYAVMDAGKVKALREEKDMSVWDLADAAGISLSTARKVERGPLCKGRRLGRWRACMDWSLRI